MADSVAKEQVTLPQRTTGAFMETHPHSVSESTFSPRSVRLASGSKSDWVEGLFYYPSSYG